MPKLKHQYFGHLMQRTNSFKRPFCWERLKAGGEGDNRRWDDWMASLTQWTEFEQVLGFGDEQGSLAYCGPWVTRSRTQLIGWTGLSHWTELNWWSPYQRWYTLNTNHFNAGELSKSLHVALAAVKTALSEGLVYVYIIPIFGTKMYEVKEEACHRICFLGSERII